MRSSVSLVVLLLLSVPLSGCLAEEEPFDENKFIVDESELNDPEGPDYCGDFAGEGQAYVSRSG